MTGLKPEASSKYCYILHFLTAHADRNRPHITHRSFNGFKCSVCSCAKHVYHSNSRLHDPFRHLHGAGVPRHTICFQASCAMPLGACRVIIRVILHNYGRVILHNACCLAFMAFSGCVACEAPSPEVPLSFLGTQEVLHASAYTAQASSGPSLPAELCKLGMTFRALLGSGKIAGALLACGHSRSGIVGSQTLRAILLQAPCVAVALHAARRCARYWGRT